VSAPTFPTLADLLAASSSRTDTAKRPVVAFFENETDTPEALEVLPSHTLVAVIWNDAGSPPVPPTDSERRAAVATVDEIVDLVRANDGAVLLVSDATWLTSAVVSGLQAALDSDSACTSVCVDEASRPVAPGLPPPAVDFPSPGVVLVRRSDLLLAVDEALLSGVGEASLAEPREGGAIVPGILSVLDRPGFVHRAFGIEGDPSSTRRSAGLQPPRTRPRTERARVVIDGSCLANPRSGTQVQTLGLIGGLARAGADVAVMKPAALHRSVVADVQRLADDVAFVERRRLGRPDVFHRPFQIVSLHDLADRLTIAKRFVLTHQDMIWDRTRAYHAGEARGDYRRGTTAALASADEVGFVSLHAAKDAASDGVLELDRATVVPNGVDHLAVPDDPSDAARPLGGRPYLLMVGSSFWHKNRLFSLRLLRQLVEQRAWEGGLVLVGGDSGHGSSADAEEAFTARHPSLSGRVLHLGHVPDEEQLALYRGAELVLFPSLYEGFGFIPFEAAALGTASVYTRRSAMGDYLPEVGALPSFDVEEAGDFVLGLLDDPKARARIVDAISAVAAGLTWDRTAAGYLEVYGRALGRDARGVDRRLLSLVPRRERLLETRAEVVLIDVYRRRRGFRMVADAGIGVAQAVRRAMRRL
jgi:glycosyltransferase involved in cell wall biosynthesis